MSPPTSTHRRVNWIVVAALALASSSFSPLVKAHSWIDCIDHSRTRVDADSIHWISGRNEKYPCEGYAWGYPGRSSSNINAEMTHMYGLSEVDANPSLPACQYQDGGYNNPSWRTMVASAPGDTLYFSYPPNGHGGAASTNSGRATTYGIYWAGKPDTKLTTFQELTDAALVGGKHDFDDGQCQDGNPIKVCVGSLQIPAETPAGTYHFVWYWRFSHNPFNSRSPQSAYTSCFSVQVTGGGRDGQPAPVATNSSVAPATTHPSSPPAPSPSCRTRV